MRYYYAALLTALCALCVWGGFGLTRHAIVAVDRLGDAGAGIAAGAAKVNGAHGTIAMMDEDAGAAKSLIVHADLVARHEQQQLKTWDSLGTTAFANLNGDLTALHTTLDAATQTANAATETLGEGKRTLDAAQPLLFGLTRSADASTQAIQALNGRLSDPRVDDLMAHLNGMSASGDKMLADAQWKTHKLLHPDKVKLTFWGSLWLGAKYVHQFEPPIF